MFTTRCVKHFLRVHDIKLTFAKMTVTYQVGEGGHLDIDFWVRRTDSCRNTGPLMHCLNLSS